jgi:hypothetical protein
MKWYQRRPLRKSTFARQYAERSNTTVEQLHEWGREAEKCDCGDGSCKGWQMGHWD